MKYCLLLLLVTSVSVSAPLSMASKFPLFDVGDHCQRVAIFGGQFSGSLQQGCLRTEHDAYAYVNSVWSFVPLSIRNICQRRAQFGGQGSYSLLKTCLERRMRYRQVETALQP